MFLKFVLLSIDAETLLYCEFTLHFQKYLSNKDTFSAQVPSSNWKLLVPLDDNKIFLLNFLKLHKSATYKAVNLACRIETATHRHVCQFSAQTSLSVVWNIKQILLAWSKWGTSSNSSRLHRFLPHHIMVVLPANSVISGSSLGGISCYFQH